MGQSVQVQELGVKADFADDPDGDDIDDLLEESEDPWMREPAGTPIFSSPAAPVAFAGIFVLLKQLHLLQPEDRNW